MADLQFRGSWKQQILPVRSQSAETLVAVVDRGPELGESILILLDLLASLQTIDQGILLDRLRRSGGKGTALQGFSSFLQGWSMLMEEAAVQPMVLFTLSTPASLAKLLSRPRGYGFGAPQILETADQWGPKSGWGCT